MQQVRSSYEPLTIANLWSFYDCQFLFVRLPIFEAYAIVNLRSLFDPNDCRSLKHVPTVWFFEANAIASFSKLIRLPIGFSLELDCRSSELASSKVSDAIGDGKSQNLIRPGFSIGHRAQLVLSNERKRSLKSSLCSDSRCCSMCALYGPFVCFVCSVYDLCVWPLCIGPLYGLSECSWCALDLCAFLIRALSANKADPFEGLLFRCVQACASTSCLDPGVHQMARNCQ